MDIKFTYSIPYEMAINQKGSLLTRAEIDKEINRMDRFWESYGYSIENILKGITGLSFTEKQISCYLNMEKSFSDPLTLKIEDPKRMQNNMIHELIHVLFSQNYDSNQKYRNKWKKYWDLYPEESRLTKSHIIVHAIHYLVSKKVFPSRDVTYDSKMKDYVRSWDIVMKETPEEIVKLIKI